MPWWGTVCRAARRSSPCPGRSATTTTMAPAAQTPRCPQLEPPPDRAPSIPGLWGGRLAGKELSGLVRILVWLLLSFSSGPPCSGCLSLAPAGGGGKAFAFPRICYWPRQVSSLRREQPFLVILIRMVKMHTFLNKLSTAHRHILTWNPFKIPPKYLACFHDQYVLKWKWLDDVITEMWKRSS
jgi:hypothetical protein